MLDVNLSPVAIFSLKEDICNPEKQLNELRLPFKKLVGCYHGIEQDSYLVPLDNDGVRLASIFELCRLNDQETVLMLRKDRSAFHIELNNGCKEKELGQFVHVCETEAMKEDSWTFDGNNYYIIKGA